MLLQEFNIEEGVRGIERLQEFNIEEGGRGRERFAGVRVGNIASVHLFYINIAYGLWPGVGDTRAPES